MNAAASLVDAWFLWPAAALVLGVVSLAPLGVQVLQRGVVFIDLAVAQAAAACALWVGAFVDHPDWFITQAVAALGALGCAMMVAWVSRRWPNQREALIGLLYVLGASAALLAARLDPHGRERMAELLAADVLWAGSTQVTALAVSAFIMLALGQRLSRDTVFYPVFAVVASLAVPVLGLFLVFAMLIAPALWERAGSSRVPACLGAIAACGVGLAASWFFDAPSGACVALALSAYGLAPTLRRF